MGVVLDSSVILKALLSPPRNLQEKVLQREVETHKKSQLILELIEEREVEVHIPAVALVEVAGVIRRLTGDKSKASLASDTIGEMFKVHYDSELLEKAKEVAILTGASGFDAYFIGLARLLELPLLTDDRGMHIRAKKIGINSVLIREASLSELRDIVR